MKKTTAALVALVLAILTFLYLAVDARAQEEPPRPPEFVYLATAATMRAVATEIGPEKWSVYANDFQPVEAEKFRAFLASEDREPEEAEE